ncbi:hypothetical protein [Agromyces sp. LHK192]|uniref:hypothetical protein n=1 Tax=Agromyces sp. LHK192 TaxID=2498704 RepID=UPI000FD7B0C7|nr:hypothetical protein [Agromyces sp. LHK192]
MTPTLTCDAAVAAVRRAAAAVHRPVIAIDGASGSGKSTFASTLQGAWPDRRIDVIRLDDVYPGWHGLDAGASTVRRRMLLPRARGAVGAVPRWDWAAGVVAGIDRLPPGRPLIVEGCGAFAAVRRLDAARVWLVASDDLRKRAALARDGGAFDPYWDLWEAQWRRYVARTRPHVAADLILRSRIG